MESGERQLRLGFDPSRPQDKMPALLRTTGRRFDQNRLADARLAAYRNRATGVDRSIDCGREDSKLVLAANDLKRRLAYRRNHSPSLPAQAVRITAVIRRAGPWQRRPGIGHPLQHSRVSHA